MKKMELKKVVVDFPEQEDIKTSAIKPFGYVDAVIYFLDGTMVGLRKARINPNITPNAWSKAEILCLPIGCEKMTGLDAKKLETVIKILPTVQKVLEILDRTFLPDANAVYRESRKKAPTILKTSTKV